MKIYFLTCLRFLIYLAGFIGTSYAQVKDSSNLEAYSRAHIAVEVLGILGVNDREYAKCVESVNFQDTALRHKMVVINGLAFTDDGKGFDLVALDGILTSKTTFKYNGNIQAVKQGMIQPLPSGYIIYDEAFVHEKDKELQNRIKINCKIKWVPCSQMTGIEKILCEIAGWPWGSFVLTECEFTVDW